MKKLYFMLMFAMVAMAAMANDSVQTAEPDTIAMYRELSEVTVSTVYYSNSNNLARLNVEQIQKLDFGQEPSYVMAHMPNVFATNDNGTEMGYGYFRIRGLDQTRINVTLDGMPWNEAEDFGAYFANSPDLMSSMHSMKVENGASSKTAGVSAAAGSIILESVDLRNDTTSYANLQYGHFNSYTGSVVYNMGLKKGWGLHLKGYIGHTDGYKDYSWNNSKALTAKIGYYFNNYHSLSFLTMNGWHDNGQGWIGSTYQELKENSRHNGCVNYLQGKNNDTDWWFQTVNKLQYDGAQSQHAALSASVFLQYQTGSYSYDCMDTIPTNVYDAGLTHYLYGFNIIEKLRYSLANVNFGLTGYSYQREHFSAHNRFKNDASVCLPYDNEYRNIGYKNDITAFINTKIHATSWMDISADIQYRGVTTNYKDIVNPTGAQPYLYKVYNFINGGFGFEFKPAYGHNVYAKLTVTNREPTRSSMFGGNEYYISECYTELKPELVHDVEVGYNLTRDNIRMNVNLFYMHFKNELILTGGLGPNGLPAHLNSDYSWRAGFEFSCDWECYPGLHFINSTGYMNGEIFITSTDSIGNKQVDVYKHVQSPNLTIDQTLMYERQCTKNFYFSIAGNFNFRSSMIYDLWSQKICEDPNEYTLPENYSVNLTCRARIFKHYEFALKFNNITRPTDCGTDKTNYVNATKDGDVTYYFQNAGFNMLGSFRFYF